MSIHGPSTKNHATVTLRTTNGVTLPNHVVYLPLATAAVLLALYSITRHLITGLIHDLADCLFGEQPPGVMVNPWECRDKFRVDWSPRALPELEELARAEQTQEEMESDRNRKLSPIWVIPDCAVPRPPRAGPRVAFGKII
ncbi:hypothetical protein ANANG_G00093560 [Anguilla anguilla]|uniref:Uncharacterized protein n=1 Tax=Anguilla anguilla TaxID=7936 RepID=A0A9D3MM64_ANGAN|nr:hypothetical protein ANANG_G00093560 [Anguilla anguilla]